MPYLLIIAAFTFAYMFIPNRRVRFVPAFAVMSLVAGRFVSGQPMPFLGELRNCLGVPNHALQMTLDELVRREFLAECAGELPIYVPARDPGLITVAQVLDAVRCAGEERFLSPGDFPVPVKVDELLAQAQKVVDLSLGRMTLRDLFGGKVEAENSEGAGTAGTNPA